MKTHCQRAAVKLFEVGEEGKENWREGVEMKGGQEVHTHKTAAGVIFSPGEFAHA